MVYLRIKPRVFARPGQKLTLGDVADSLSDARLRLSEMLVSLPRGEGVFLIDALQLIVQIQSRMPDEVVNVLGSGVGWLYREDIYGKTRARAVARAVSIALLLATGAFAALWLLPGDPVRLLLRMIPYALGVVLGASAYRVLSGRKAIAPLSIKLQAYRGEAQKHTKQGGRP